ncbi:hypothetical protein ACPCIR_05865 [Mycobacterium sp. NPDC051198]
MSRWLPRWLESRQAILGDDATTTAMMKKLNAAHRNAGETHDIERATLALQLGASQRRDSASRHKLKRAVNRVENAERRYRIANARVDRFKGGALVTSLLAYESEEAARAKARAAKEIDHHTPHVSPLVVTLAELVLLVAEFAFYFDIFGRSLPDDAPPIQQIFTAVLAVLVPVVGIMSARFFAGSVQHLRIPNDDGIRRSSIVFVVVSTILLAVACYSTVRLVEWRYRAEDAASFGSAEHPPGTVMAIVFVVFILVDALIRAFMFDPSERTNIGRRWKARYTRAVDWWLLLRESAALARWQKRWFSAKALVEKLKNDADQELLTGTISILLSRGETGRRSSQLYGWPDAEGEGGTVDADGQPIVRTARTTGSPDEQLDEANAHVFLPHRLIRLAVARLDVIKPPEDPKQEQRPSTDDLTQVPVPAPHSLSRLAPAEANGTSVDHGVHVMIDDTVIRTG